MNHKENKFPDNGFEAWGGYMQAKVAKLEEQFSSGIGQAKNHVSNIFEGVSIYVNGFTIPSADELKELIAKHGGIYHTYQRKDDFIIASNLPDTKVKNMPLSRVIRPEWITDSISANRLKDFKEYLLYGNSRTQKRIHFASTKTSFVTNEIPANSISSENCTLNVENIQTHMEGKITPQGSSSETTDKKIILSKSPTTGVKKYQPITTKTAADPNFISEFYNNSRLHHISQLGAHFKQYVNDLRENSDFTFPMRMDLRTRIFSLGNSNNNVSIGVFQNNKIIMHIDMDCFFVSVGLRKRPDLRGKPVGVTHSKGGLTRSKRTGVDRVAEFNLYKQKLNRNLSKATGISDDEIKIETRVDNIANEDEKFGSMSEIASCSYEARAKGISNGMFMGAALRLCPDLQTIPYDFEGYKEVAHTLYNTIAQYTLDIEAVSCDEMYVDCTELLQELNVSVYDFASALREEIKNKTGCPCSTGFGSNRLQARLATKRAKPDGQFFLTSDLIDDFMLHINLRDLPGVGRQTSQKLESLGYNTCGSLQVLSLLTLQRHLGNKTGAQLYDQCRGHDQNNLSFYTIRKSVSAEVNYGIRFDNNEQCEEFLKQLSTEVHSRMRQFKVMGKCITLKLMIRAKDAPVETAKFMGHGFCDVVNKSSTLQNATNDVNIIIKEVTAICRKQNIDPKEMRGVGIQITKLESLNSKHIKGSINNFFKSRQSVKTENTKMELANDNIESTHFLDQYTENKTTAKTPVTPKKQKTVTHEKKSPILGNSKSHTIGRKKGRPPKTVKANVASSNLMSRFLQGQGTSHEYPKKEIVENTSSINKTVQIESKPHGLLGLPWEKVRELLRAWFDSGQAPKLCDINLVVAYMQDMIASKDIDKVYILVNFIKRRTSELNNDLWNEVQNCVVEEVQNAMVAVYGYKLWINDY